MQYKYIVFGGKKMRRVHQQVINMAKYKLSYTIGLYSQSFFFLQNVCFFLVIHVVLIDFLLIYVLTNLLNAILCMHVFFQNKVYPRELDHRDQKVRGRIRVQLRDNNGGFLMPEYKSRKNEQSSAAQSALLNLY